MLSILAATVLSASPEFSFAFTNEPGTEVLALEELETPARFTKVSCDGQVFDLVFVAVQPKGPNDTGRQTAQKFDQVAGARFKLAMGKVSDNVMCLIGTEAFFAQRKLLPVTKVEGEEPCPAEASAAMQKLGGRKVRSCFSTASFEGGHLFFANFERKGANALAGVMVQLEGGASALRAFPTKYEKDSPSCWRADDGCRFGPRDYTASFAMTGPAGVELFALWGGAEGENAELLRVKGTRLTVVSSGSRYWSPE